jgi:hypothetical protein
MAWLSRSGAKPQCLAAHPHRRTGFGADCSDVEAASPLRRQILETNGEPA